VQLWNTVWTPADITADNGNPTGVITTQPTSNLVARYELTQSLEGLETKPTHPTSEPLIDGVIIAFTNGAGGNAFVATDFHTFGMVDGLLKDNATSFSQYTSVYYKPTDFDFQTFLNAAGTNIIDAATRTITEPVKFTRFSNFVTSSTSNRMNVDATIGMYLKPGEISYPDSSVNSVLMNSQPSATTTL